MKRPEETVAQRRNPRTVDVVKLAGVSHQTVSRVLNGNPNVSIELFERVERAIRQLGYRWNPMVRALRPLGDAAPSMFWQASEARQFLPLRHWSRNFWCDPARVRRQS